MTATKANPSMFADCKTYASRASAQRKIEKVCGEVLYQPGVQWLVLAQPDGRFTPCVRLAACQQHLAFPFANAGVCVIA